MDKDKLFEAIKNHIEHWKKECGYTIPFDYHGLNNIIDNSEWIASNAKIFDGTKLKEELKKIENEST